MLLRRLYPSRLTWNASRRRGSRLDIATERQITAAIKARGPTRVMIAHRPETIAAAQRKLMLHDRELHKLQQSS